MKGLNIQIIRREWAIAIHRHP